MKNKFVIISYCQGVEDQHSILIGVAIAAVDTVVAFE